MQAEVLPDFGWKAEVQFYPDGTVWKRDGPQNLYDHVEKGGFFDGWAYPTDGIRGDTGKYSYGNEDTGTPSYVKIYRTYRDHPGLYPYLVAFFIPSIFLQIWGWWNYPRSQKELEDRM